MAVEISQPADCCLGYVSSTIITIAHRLNTVLDYDKILVLKVLALVRAHTRTHTQTIVSVHSDQNPSWSEVLIVNFNLFLSD